MSRHVGIGLISAGWMGTVHSRAYLAAREKYPELGVTPDLVVVADTVKANARRAADRLGYRETTDDYRAVLAAPEVDVVSICGPELPPPRVRAGGHRGRQAVLDREAHGRGHRRLPCDRRRDRGIRPGHVRGLQLPARTRDRPRARPDPVRALGRITNVRCRFDADYSSSPDGPRTWRFVKAQAGSGVIGDLLSHGFDLAQYLVGAIGEVTALTRTVHPRASAGGGGRHRPQRDERRGRPDAPRRERGLGGGAGSLRERGDGNLRVEPGRGRPALRVRHRRLRDTGLARVGASNA